MDSRKRKIEDDEVKNLIPEPDVCENSTKKLKTSNDEVLNPIDYFCYEIFLEIFKNLDSESLLSLSK